MTPDARRRLAGELMTEQFNRPTPQDTAVVDRASLLPFGTYANGMTGPAIPGFITQPFESFKRLMDEGYTSGSEQGAEDAFNVAGAAMVGGLAAPKPSNTVGIFGGRLAKTADHAKLAQAERMEKEGFARNDIRTQTGWFKDPGGNWRFEIDDSKATYTPGTGKLGNVLQHDPLYEAYPQLRNLPVGNNVNPLANGQYLPKNQGALASVLERFTGPSARIDMAPGAGRSSILHETQHAVDDIEGALANLNKSNPYGTAGQVTANSASYRDAPFEQAARGTQARADLTPAEREARAPWLDYSGKPAPQRKASTKPLPPISQEGGLPVLPERTALEEAYRGINLDPNDRYIRAAIEQFKGPRLKDPSITDSLVDSALGRDGLDSVISKDPAWQNWGRAVEDYRAKAQLLGHNGGPAPSTWEDPFIYSLKDGTSQSIGMSGRPEAALNAAGERQGIRAYHGSPHDFDRFDMSKIGTGEGAQAYGHGLYFAEREGVAKSYRDALGGQKLKDGTSFDERNPAHWAAEYVSRADGDTSKALDLLRADMTPDMKTYEGAQYQRLLRARGMIEKGETIPEIGRGKMYEVRINANPDDFLDWDKPLSQQSEKVRQIVEPEAKRVYEQRVRDGTQRTADDAWHMRDALADPERGLQSRLREAGIPGIKYLDQGSRTQGEGSRNYVVFDDNLVEILRKYGLLGMAGGAAANEIMSNPNKAIAQQLMQDDANKYRGAI